MSDCLRETTIIHHTLKHVVKMHINFYFYYLLIYKEIFSFFWYWFLKGFGAVRISPAIKFVFLEGNNYSDSHGIADSSDNVRTEVGYLKSA